MVFTHYISIILLPVIFQFFYTVTNKLQIIYYQCNLKSTNSVTVNFASVITRKTPVITAVILKMLKLVQNLVLRYKAELTHRHCPIPSSPGSSSAKIFKWFHNFDNRHFLWEIVSNQSLTAKWHYQSSINPLTLIVWWVTQENSPKNSLETSS